jgi:hypothetical protein
MRAAKNRLIFCLALTGSSSPGTSEELKRNDPVGVLIGPRQSFSRHNLDASGPKATRQAEALKILKTALDGEKAFLPDLSTDSFFGLQQGSPHVFLFWRFIRWR